MATIQLKRQLKFAHPKSEAISYIKTKITLLAGEPLLCTYKESNGKWGAIEVICVYPKGTSKDDYMLLSQCVSSDMFDENGKLKENILKINADEVMWDKI
jgi:hypothetical protein